MSEKIKILAVDDEKDVIKFLGEFLENAGFEFIGILNGKEGEEAVKKERPSVVLLDIMMPGMDGFEVCTKLREDPENASMAVVMLTGRDRESDIVRALEAGADDYLTKPFTNEQLLTRIHFTLSKAQAGMLPSQLHAKKIREREG